MENKEIAVGKAPSGTEVKVFDEDGLKVVRDFKGNRITHSDTIEGLQGAGFKFEEPGVSETHANGGEKPKGDGVNVGGAGSENTPEPAAAGTEPAK